MAIFAECVVRQKMESGVIIIAVWSEFTLEFTVTFWPEMRQ
jgi:hypothetical protein